MSDTKHISAALGTDAIASAVGVSAKTVTEAVRLGQFPAAWWLAMSDLARGKGVHLGEHLFSFKRGDAA